MGPQARLQHFPISWFAMIMGLSGLSIAWHKSETILSLPLNISHYVLWVTIAVFVILAAFYVIKLFRYREEVVKELKHPIKLNFFPTVSIGLILLSIALLHHDPVISRVLWICGASLHLLFTLYVLSVWMHHTHFEIHHINPAWFIPIVGNILVPIAGVNHASQEISWFFFSIGLVFWVVLMTIIFYRMLFHQPLPARMIPTLFILIAPPAVGFISWLQLTGEVDAFARILYYAAGFLTLMLVSQIHHFIRLKFFLSWWAYSFPLAAFTVATLLMYQHIGLSFFKVLSIALLATLSLVMLILIYMTLHAVFRKEICIEE